MTHDLKANGKRKHRTRPFPWTCFNCGKDEMRPQTIPYTTRILHDGQHYQIDIPELTTPKCAACGHVVLDYNADDQVLDAMRLQLNLLTPQQIKAGRKALGLKPKEIAAHLGVAAETYSQWERGGVMQPLVIDNFL